MWVKSELACALLVCLAISVLIVNTSTVWAQTDQASSKLQAANDAVNHAFNQVLAAEKAGANVSELLSQLNVVSGLLAQVENDYRSGDSTFALNNADGVVSAAGQVSSAAQVAESNAVSNGKTALWSTVAFSVFGSVFFILGVLFVWKFFRENYVKKLSKAKPEVISR